jgi:3-hydroxybutyryl-CoA dehydrogenase
MTKIGIVGCGVMGTGIAQLVAQAGLDVILYNRNDGTYAARDKLFKTFEMLESKGKLASAELIKQHVATAETLQELAGCSLIIEAITESFDAKVELFKQLEDIVAPTCIIASNTSSFSITSLSAKLRLPERVAGLHFFNPVPLMKVVELVKSSFTDTATIDALATFVSLIGHTVVQTKDTPGFVINHAGRAYVTEAMHILTEDVAPFYQVDRIMRDTLGFRMGPCELLDLTALDVSHPVMVSIFEQFFFDPRYRPKPLTAQMLAAGHVGRKAGRGFYKYVDGKQEQLPEQDFASAEPAIWSADPDVVEALYNMDNSWFSKCARTKDTADVMLITAWGFDATTACINAGLDPKKTVAIDLIGSLQKRVVLMTTPVTLQSAVDAAATWFKLQGREVTVIRDSNGFVAQRMLASIVNLASEIAQQSIAEPTDIDKAVQLGLGYPVGPLAWGDKVGAARILEILNNIYTQTGDPRYRPSQWLRRRAQLGVSLLTKGL